MKRVLFILLCMLTMLSGAYCQDYYWYKGKQIPLERGNQRYIIYNDYNARGLDSIHIIETGDVSASKNQNLKWAIVDQESEIIAPNVVYQTPSFYGAGTKHDIFVTHRFSVKLKSDKDFAMLQQYANKYNAEIEKDKYLPLWYILTCDFNAPYNALDLANIFYETGLFAISEPEFSHVAILDCVNDYYFADQWNLKNTGQYGVSYSGIDINYCDAHAITTGNSSIIIGVYDIGVDLTHPDINLFSFSYDANTHSSPSTIYTSANGNNYHGTACAGIIGSKTNNNIGYAGIAPDCPIMSISFYNTTTTNIRDAFIVAANNGCSVISNSWSLSSPFAEVDDGISYALSQGRSGKGCVVVFSAGNNDRDSVNYPANSNDSILVVGAMSPCGERCNPYSCDDEYWGSNYGNKLDVVAPGVKIRTTDLVGGAGYTSGNYMDEFNGTSSACPHVAAVAGLLLSVNPYLTQKEVADIIKNTARKVGGYNYTTHVGHPNGTWNYYMGYGLVDAFEAVRYVSGYNEIQNSFFVCDTTKYYLRYPSDPGTVINWSLQNPTSLLWDYSLIGPTNQDTVLVKRTYGSMIPLSGSGVRNTLPDDSSSLRGIVPILSVSITTPMNQSYTTNKVLETPTDNYPYCTIDSNDTWYVGNPRTLTVTNCLSEPDSAFLWVAKRRFSSTTTTHRGRTFTFTPTSFGSYTISVTNTNSECGYATVNYKFDVDYNLSMNAAWNNDQLNIEIVTDGDDIQNRDASSNYTLELWHVIFGRMYTGTMNSNSAQINTQDFPQGTYVVVLKDKGDIIAQTKVQK